jgi:hypothetical protein
MQSVIQLNNDLGQAKLLATSSILVYSIFLLGVGSGEMNNTRHARSDTKKV